jgi:hypothetical protein
MAENFWTQNLFDPMERQKKNYLSDQCAKQTWNKMDKAFWLHILQTNYKDPDVHGRTVRWI